MPSNPPRRFTLLDAGVLIAATAPGLACVRHYISADRTIRLNDVHAGWRILSILPFLWRLVLFSEVFLALWSVALLGLRLRQPRPPLRRLPLQPGTVVTCAASLAIAWAAVLFLVRMLIGQLLGASANWLHPVRADLSFYSVPILLVHLIYLHVANLRGEIAFSVTVAWVLLAWSRRCRPEPSWLDRGGRLLGVFWILAYLLQWYTAEALRGLLGSM